MFGIGHRPALLPLTLSIGVVESERVQRILQLYVDLV